MPMYTFYLRKLLGGSTSLAALELSHDGESFTTAGSLLDEHLSCDHVDVWAGERAVFARHRMQPIIRPVDEDADSEPRRPPGGISASRPDSGTPALGTEHRHSPFRNSGNQM